MGTRTLLLLFLEFWVLLMGVGVRGGGSAKEGVTGTEWSEAGVGAIFHSDKINSALKGGEGRTKKAGQAYLGLQRSKGGLLKVGPTLFLTQSWDALRLAA